MRLVYNFLSASFIKLCYQEQATPSNWLESFSGFSMLSNYISNLGISGYLEVWKNAY